MYEAGSLGRLAFWLLWGVTKRFIAGVARLALSSLYRSFYFLFWQSGYFYFNLNLTMLVDGYMCNETRTKKTRTILVRLTD